MNVIRNVTGSPEEFYEHINSCIEFDGWLLEIPKVVKLADEGSGWVLEGLKKNLWIGVASGCALFSFYLTVRKYRGGPYESALKFAPSRILQRILVDKSRRHFDTAWFPLDSLTQVTERKKDNGHKISGQVRDAARKMIYSAISGYGCSAFEISPADVIYSKPENCDLQHYACSDLHQPVSDSVVEGHHVVVMTDVDHFIENFSKYATAGVPMIMHGFNPLKVAGADGDCRFRIISDVVHYEVGGGGNWSHEVWDWTKTGEFIEFNYRVNSLSTLLLALVGIRKKIIHKIHVARPWADCPDRVLVWTIPQYSFYSVNWLGNDLRSRKLERVKYRDCKRPGWNSLVYLDEENELQFNFGREGADASTTMLKEHVDMLLPLKTPQSVTTRMLNLKYLEIADMANFLQFYEGNNDYNLDCYRMMRCMQPQVHWPIHSYSDNFQTKARVYSNPLVSDHNLMPDIRNWEALSQSLEERVTFVKNTATPESRYGEYARQFIDLVLGPYKHQGVALGIDETIDELDKPAQILQTKMVVETLDSPIRELITGFLKNEPIMKDGRIISAFADFRYILQLSRFTLAMRNEVLHAEHNRHWFCPGLTPKQISGMVVDYVSSVPEPVEGDYTNFDGRVSAWMQRHVMNAMYTNWVRREDQLELGDLLKVLISCPAKSKAFGFQYKAGVGVKSGSPTTCDANTIANGFMMYVAAMESGISMQPELAFRSIGLAFGDDSLFETRCSVTWKRVARDLGMELKIVEYDATKGIGFLGRIFPDPYTTDTSFQDPLRTLRKLHLTTRHNNIPIGSAAIDRLTGYLVTDKLTPLISDYCKMIVKHYSGLEGAESDERREKRASKLSEKPYWLVGHENESWPQAAKDKELMMSCIASRMGYQVEVIEDFINRINTAAGPWGIPTLNSSEESYQWKGTVASCGTPVDTMDPHKISKATQIQNANVQRANPSSARGNRSDNRKDHEAGDGTREQGVKAGGPSGSSGFRRVPKQTGGESSKCNNKPADETDSAGGARREDRSKGGENPSPPNRSNAHDGSKSTGCDGRGGTRSTGTFDHRRSRPADRSNGGARKRESPAHVPKTSDGSAQKRT